MKKTFWCVLLSCLLATSVIARVAPAVLKIPTYQPHDFTFTSSESPVTPFLIKFSAEFTGPNGIKLIVPGFLDGDNLWKVRFSAPVAGKWSLLTHADQVNDLNNQKLQFVVIANPDPKQHGGLKVDPLTKRHFVFDDFTYWFPVGYECNWLWALDEHDDKLPTVNAFLDKLTTYGFNFILINAYAYDTSWKPGKTSADDYAPSALYPWMGTNDKPDFKHFNLAYWQHFDKVMDAMYKRGIVAHLYFKVYNKKVNWPQNDKTEDDLYYNWVIARYAAYPNLIWDLAKEANNEKSALYKEKRAQMIRAADPYHHLLTAHTDIKTYDNGAYNNLLDFRTDQFQEKVHETMQKNLAQNIWPVMNVESGYEFGPLGPSDKTYNRAESPDDVARKLWAIQMAGGYTAYYYTYTAWDVIRPNEAPPGYTYVKNFSSFFNKTSFWRLKPADSLVNKGYCMADPGKEYIVYQNQAEAFTLNLNAQVTQLKAYWYRPFRGKYLPGPTISAGTATYTPPADISGGPVVLLISNKVIL